MNDTAADLLPGYVLGILDEDEQLLVEAGLASSATLRNEYQRYLNTVDSVNVSMPLATPPDNLGPRILASASPASQVEPTPIRRPRLPVALSAAAALLVIVLGGAVAILLGEVDEQNEQIDSLQTSASSRSRTDFTQPLVWTAIGSDSGDTPVEGYFCRTEDGSVGWIIVDGMYMHENHMFQLWLVDGERIVDGGMFVTDEAGRGFGVVRVDVPVHTFSQIWITTEPPGGSPLPTTDPDLKAPIV